MKNRGCVKQWAGSIFLILALGVPGFCRAQEEDAFMLTREAMVQNQIERRGIKDEKVLASMREVKRHLFVPRESQMFSYEDYPLSIGHGQTISQPYIVAYMTEAVRLKPEDKVLEIGTGSGYQAAVLAEIVKEVYTVEIIPVLAREARQRLEDLDYRNVFVKCGDGFEGWPEHAPYDVIIVTAAPQDVPAELIDQLKTGGRMVVPVGSITQELYVITKTQDGIDKKSVLPVRFVPMVGEQGRRK